MGIVEDNGPIKRRKAGSSTPNESDFGDGGKRDLVVEDSRLNGAIKSKCCLMIDGAKVVYNGAKLFQIAN